MSSLSNNTSSAPVASATQSAKTGRFAGFTVKDLLGHKKKVHSVDWSCDGARLATGGADQTARIWDVEAHTTVGGQARSSASRGVTLRLQGREIVLKGHTDSLDQLCWHPSKASELATASADKTVQFWDTRGVRGASDLLIAHCEFCTAAKSIQTVPTSGENINIAWSKQGYEVAVGNKDDLLTFIDVRKYKVARTVRFAYEVKARMRYHRRRLIACMSGQRDLLERRRLVVLPHDRLWHG
jgi:THO complex subunit 3